jgi:hypothetical protein
MTRPYERNLDIQTTLQHLYFVMPFAPILSVFAPLAVA